MNKRMAEQWDIDLVRSHFPALGRIQNGLPAAFLDGAAGSQVPLSVAEAVSRYLLTTNANRGAAHATSHESDELLENAHRVLADFLGTEDPGTICFGANMTTITFGLSRVLAKQWGPGDEIIVSRLDHDANVTPWVLAAEDAGATVRHIELRPDEWTLDLEDFHDALSEKTKLVAIGLASNATGTINPVQSMVAAAHGVGALTFVDAVHYAPHRRINVSQLKCDFLVCSAYKFFGPHLGVMYGRRDLLENLSPCKLRPASDELPDRWMTGTQNHEGIAGAVAAVEYLAMLGDGNFNARREDGHSEQEPRTVRLNRAFHRITEYEDLLTRRFLETAVSVPNCRVHGITDPWRTSERVPTFSLTCNSRTTQELAGLLAERGIFTWSGNHYALPFTEAAGLEPGGTLRISALHYNLITEIDQVVECLRGLTA